MRNAIYLGTVLASLIFFSGCSTEVTQDYQPRISMTKSEALEVVKKHVESVKLAGSLWSAKSASVDTTGIAATFSVVFYSRDAFYAHTRSSNETFTLAFADVVRIAKAGNIIALSKSGAQLVVGMRSSLCFTVKRSDSDEFVSALLTLCPNVK